MATFSILQQRKEKPKEEIIDHYRPQGEEFDKAYTYDYKSRTDEISQPQVSSEKITVSTRDLTRMEETETPRYPKDLNIGRIVIEEIPEVKEKVIKSDVGKRDEVKPRREDIESRYEVEGVPRKQVLEDVVKVGRLDITEYEKSPRVSEREEKRPTTESEKLLKEKKVD